MSDEIFSPPFSLSSTPNKYIPQTWTPRSNKVTFSELGSERLVIGPSVYPTKALQQTPEIAFGTMPMNHFNIVAAVQPGKSLKGCTKVLWPWTPDNQETIWIADVPPALTLTGDKGSTHDFHTFQFVLHDKETGLPSKDGAKVGGNLDITYICCMPPNGFLGCSGYPSANLQWVGLHDENAAEAVAPSNWIMTLQTAKYWPYLRVDGAPVGGEVAATAAASTSTCPESLSSWTIPVKKGTKSVTRFDLDVSGGKCGEVSFQSGTEKTGVLEPASCNGGKASYEFSLPITDNKVTFNLEDFELTPFCTDSNIAGYTLYGEGSAGPSLRPSGVPSSSKPQAYDPSGNTPFARFVDGSPVWSAPAPAENVLGYYNQCNAVSNWNTQANGRCLSGYYMPRNATDAFHISSSSASAYGTTYHTLATSPHSLGDPDVCSNDAACVAKHNPSWGCCKGSSGGGVCYDRDGYTCDVNAAGYGNPVQAVYILPEVVPYNTSDAAAVTVGFATDKEYCPNGFPDCLTCDNNPETFKQCGENVLNRYQTMAGAGSKTHPLCPANAKARLMPLSHYYQRKGDKSLSGRMDIMCMKEFNCTDDSSCSGQKCNTQTGQCVCTSTTNCPSGYTCAITSEDGTGYCTRKCPLGYGPYMGSCVRLPPVDSTWFAQNDLSTLCTSVDSTAPIGGSSCAPGPNFSNLQTIANQRGWDVSCNSNSLVEKDDCVNANLGGLGMCWMHFTPSGDVSPPTYGDYYLPEVSNTTPAPLNLDVVSETKLCTEATCAGSQGLYLGNCRCSVETAQGNYGVNNMGVDDSGVSNCGVYLALKPGTPFPQDWP